MKHYSLGPLNLVLGKKFGRDGPQENANFSCRQWLIIDVGLQTVLQEEAFSTLTHGLYVIRLMKKIHHTTCWSHAFSHANYGSTSCNSLA